MIGYARYGYAKYDSNVLKQMKHCTSHLSNHGYHRGTVNCLGPCQGTVFSFIPCRSTMTCCFCELVDQPCRWYTVIDLAKVMTCVQRDRVLSALHYRAHTIYRKGKATLIENASVMQNLNHSFLCRFDQNWTKNMKVTGV